MVRPPAGWHLVRSFGTHHEEIEPRARPGWWLTLVLILAATTMTACVSAGVQQGVFAVRTDGGALTWIGEPAGVPVWSPIDESIAWGNEDGLFLRALMTLVRDEFRIPRLRAFRLVSGWEESCLHRSRPGRAGRGGCGFRSGTIHPASRPAPGR